MRITSSVLSVLALTGTIACGKSEPPKPSIEVAGGQQTSAPAAPAPATAAEQPGGMMAAGHAPAVPQAAPAALASISGTIVETMDSGGYTYMKLKLADGSELWAAVNLSKVKKGQKVDVVNAAPMDGFESKTLGRKFEHIVFGQLAAGAPTTGSGPAPMAGGQAPPPEMQAQAQAQMAAQHAGVSKGADVGKIDVPKAEGKEGRRVAEVWAQRAQLKDQTVVIRGKVVKFTPGVMGRNWLHLRDGSGSDKTRDADITVTTKDGAAVGDTVVIKGKVGLDRDFGMGYAYPILIEEATVTK